MCGDSEDATCLGVTTVQATAREICAGSSSTLTRGHDKKEAVRQYTHKNSDGMDNQNMTTLASPPAIAAIAVTLTLVSAVQVEHVDVSVISSQKAVLLTGRGYGV